MAFPAEKIVHVNVDDEDTRKLEDLYEANDQLVNVFKILQDEYFTKKEHLSDAAKMAMLQINQRNYIQIPQSPVGDQDESDDNDNGNVDDDNHVSTTNKIHACGLSEENLLEIRLASTYLSEIASTRTRIGGKALHVGFDTGYFTACLAVLLGDKGQVIALDRDEETVKTVTRRFEQYNPELLTSGRVKFFVGDGSEGFASQGPYDFMAMCVQLSEMPPSIVNQLNPRGILIATVGSRNNWSLQKITKDAEGAVTITILKKKTSTSS